MPLWWWAIADPSKQYGTLNLGLYTVTSTGWALVTTGLGLVLLPVAALLNRAAAAGHAGLAARMLGPSRPRSFLALSPVVSGCRRLRQPAPRTVASISDGARTE